MSETLKIGTRVRITHKPEHDALFTRSGNDNRAACNGKVGTIEEPGDGGWILSRGEIPPDVRPVSASSAGEWQCVSCHAHETEMHRAWCEIEGAAGTVASRATDAQPVAPPTPDLDALRARREELRAKMAGDGGDRSTSPLVALIRELAEIEAQIEATKEGAK